MLSRNQYTDQCLTLPRLACCQFLRVVWSVQLFKVELYFLRAATHLKLIIFKLSPLLNICEALSNIHTYLHVMCEGILIIRCCLRVFILTARSNESLCRVLAQRHYSRYNAHLFKLDLFYAAIITRSASSHFLKYYTTYSKREKKRRC